MRTKNWQNFWANKQTLKEFREKRKVAKVTEIHWAPEPRAAESPAHCQIITT